MAYLGNRNATGENNSFKILDDLAFTTTFDGSDVETLNKMSKLAQEKGGTIEKVGTTSSTSIDVEMHKITFPDGSSKTYNLKTQDGLDEYEVDSKNQAPSQLK